MDQPSLSSTVPPRAPDVPIKITSVRTVVVNAEMRNWLFVKVTTDQDGLYGWGEASLNWKTRAVSGTIEDLEQLLIGRDPRDIEQCLRVMNKHSYYRLGIIGATAISGIEHALWDIFGKSVGLPVWRLLGGQVRDKVRVYTHLGLGDMRSVYETFDKGALRDKALQVVEMGYDALKVVFIPYSHFTAGIPGRRHVAALMEVLRDAVGDGVDIMIDFHGRPASISAALQFIDELTPVSPDVLRGAGAARRHRGDAAGDPARRLPHRHRRAADRLQGVRAALRREGLQRRAAGSEPHWRHPRRQADRRRRSRGLTWAWRRTTRMARWRASPRCTSTSPPRISSSRKR